MNLPFFKTGPAPMAMVNRHKMAGQTVRAFAEIEQHLDAEVGGWRILIGKIREHRPMLAEDIGLDATDRAMVAEDIGLEGP